MIAHRDTRLDSGSERGSTNYCSVVELVRVQAAANPNALAVAHGPRMLTYGELNAQANQLAAQFIARGLQPGATVGLALGHCVQFITGALAILKAGAAYLPLNPDHPAERLSFMLRDSGASVLVTDSHFPSLAEGPWMTMHLDEQQALPASSFSEPPVNVDASALAYLIYTSGSTGKPKAVEVTHNNLLNLVRWHNRAFNISPKDRAPFMAAVSFDAAVWEIWPYLVAGASLHLLADRSSYNIPSSLQRWLLEQKITIGFVPTPLAEQLLRLKWPRETPLRIMLTGADTLHEYPSPNLPFQLVNNYGPTECTVVATSGIVETADGSSLLPDIGRPIDNTQIYILDSDLQPVPTAVLGEIYVGGAGVASAYRNDRALTAEKFVRNPFSSNPADRLYRTGDFGYWRDDGRIVFAGRADDQVKIRGHRVDTNEIVAVLGRHPLVRTTAVMARADAMGTKFLVAYVVAESESELTPKTLREFLHGSLPDYMVPTIFVRVNELPLTSHGKVDCRALPVPDSENTLRDDMYAAPRNSLETEVGAIIAGLLKLKDVGVSDNFFLLGGNSFLGIQLIARIQETFGIDVPLRTLFEAPTIAELSEQIAQLDARRTAA